MLLIQHAQLLVHKYPEATRGGAKKPLLQQVVDQVSIDSPDVKVGSGAIDDTADLERCSCLIAAPFKVHNQAVAQQRHIDQPAGMNGQLSSFQNAWPEKAQKAFRATP
ncbi:hypothetical protein [Pseudomonas neuropathica]|uniref:hypothetical protein n=1 Tax=Pseudomonas neuropathica TaxID=2730425 RepID=UPI003EB9DAD6